MDEITEVFGPLALMNRLLDLQCPSYIDEKGVYHFVFEFCCSNPLRVRARRGDDGIWTIEGWEQMTEDEAQRYWGDD